MKNNCIRKQRREHAFLRRFWAPAFCATMFLSAVTITAIDTSFAAEVLETRLRGGVPNANPAVGTPSNVLPNGFSLQQIAEGIDPIENPSGKITFFGFLSDETKPSQTKISTWSSTTIRAARYPTLITVDNSCSKVTKTAATWPM